MSRREQRLQSGLVIRQDFKDAVRFVMFETDVEGWEYATHGGTAFVVSYKGTPYAVIPGHVLGDFNWRQLAVTDTKYGEMVAGLQAVHRLHAIAEASEGTDLLDLQLIRFSDDVDATFFKGSAYVVDPSTVAISSTGDQLVVHGALKEKSEIGEATIKPVFAELTMVDAGPSRSDSTLRRAEAKYPNPQFSEVTGLSGSPVYNLTRNGVAGVVVRAGLAGDGALTLHYVDFSDIARALEAVHEGVDSFSYTKAVTR